MINEEIKDLLVGGGGSNAGRGEGVGGGDGSCLNGGLPLRENLQGEVTVTGLSQHEVISNNLYST